MINRVSIVWFCTVNLMGGMLSFLPVPLMFPAVVALAMFSFVVGAYTQSFIERDTANEIWVVYNESMKWSAITRQGMVVHNCDSMFQAAKIAIDYIGAPPESFEVHDVKQDFCRFTRTR